MSCKHERIEVKDLPKITWIKLICHCGKEYKAKRSDLLRHYGLSCSKSCAAKKRTYKRLHPKLAGTDLYLSYLKTKTAKRKNEPNDIRYVERAIARDEAAKQGGYYPFDSPDEMYAAMCDNPVEGR
jgi:hypothetical protein